MQKIPTLYERDRTTFLVTDQVTPGCQWVLDGEGVPTRKYDGTCVYLHADGTWWARREVKPNQQAPAHFWFIEKDLLTGKTMGWEPVEQTGWAKQLRDAIEHDESLWPEVILPLSQTGSYELCGPKINGNPEHFEHHRLIRHGRDVLEVDRGLSPTEMVLDVARYSWEGIVWHHPDGRMAKLKARDLQRPGRPSRISI